MSKSDWMAADDGDEDYVEINFLPDERCPEQIRIWARPGPDGRVHRADVRVEIIRHGSSED